MYDDMIDVQKALDGIRGLKPSVTGDAVRAAADRVDEMTRSLSAMSAGLGQLMNILQQADVAPTTQLVSAVARRHADFVKLVAEANALNDAAR
jgi:hypothetical protein